VIYRVTSIASDKTAAAFLLFEAHRRLGNEDLKSFWDYSALRHSLIAENRSMHATHTNEANTARNNPCASSIFSVEFLFVAVE
jgi:hypothetical protein